MKKHRMHFSIISVLLFILAGIMVGCASQPQTSPPEVTQPPVVEETVDTHDTTSSQEDEHMEIEGDLIRGGLLYDKWWAAREEGEEGEEHVEGDEHGHEAEGPEGDHPLWKTQTTNTRTGEDTWRCKECHGWDYKGIDGAYGSGSHTTGFAGIYQAKDKSPEELLDIMKGSTNPDHDFSSVMDEHSLNDLVIFMSQALIDTDQFVNADKSAKGDATQGETKYKDVCVYCHGPQGNAINFDSLEEPEFLGHLAQDNPWEFLHKVRFGQPGWPMPSAITNEWTDQEVTDVLAYAQTFTTDSAVSGGGLLYDKWWDVLGMEAPTTDQPLWKTQTTNTRTGSDTWRCKECHGWDYKGVDGAYASGSHMTGFAGILGAATKSSDELIGWLTGKNNPDHDFSGVMDEVALNAMVTFMQEEMQDVSPYIDADKMTTGDPASGKQKFEKTCAGCHGVDGKEMNFGDDAEPEYVGTIGVDNPWEFFHKVSYGHPGVPMPAGIGLGYTMEDRADLLAYVQTLPTK